MTRTDVPEAVATTVRNLAGDTGIPEAELYKMVLMAGVSAVSTSLTATAALLTAQGGGAAGGERTPRAGVIPFEGLGGGPPDAGSES